MRRRSEFRCPCCWLPRRGGWPDFAPFCSTICDDRYVSRWYTARLRKDPLFFLRGEW